MRKFFILFLMFIFSLNINMFAQDDNFKVPLSLGLYGGLNVNMHNPNFPENNDYPLFNTNATSLGGNVGLIGYFPINETFVISGRVGYNSMGGLLKSNIFDGMQQELDFSLSYLEISPIVQFHNLLPIKPLYFLAGLEFGIPLTKSATISEINTNTIPVSEDIPSTSTRAAFALGLGYMYQVSDKIIIAPEASFRFPFTKISSDNEWVYWTAPQLRLGVNITFSLEKDITEEPALPPADIKLGFKEVRYYNPDGTTAPVQSIKVEDVQYTELFPFIPYVFLDENTIEPSGNTQVLIGKTEAGEFSMQKLEPDAVKINMSTLDVIGSRMENNPNADLIIIGTNDGTNEKNSKDLSLMRAVYAKDYLIENYDINPDKITVKGGELPSKPSSLRDPDGIAENRRIEFRSSTPELFKPILIESENQRLADPALIEFIPETESADSIESWTMEISQSDKILRKNVGAGIPPSMQWSIRPNELTNKQVPIDYRLTAKTANGAEKSASGSIPIEYYSSNRKKTEDLPDRIVSKFSLILFDFDNAEVSAADKKVIDEYILPAIKYNSTIKIYGYTDRIGNENYNQNLAKKRAEAVRDIIKSKMKDVKIDVFGVGEGVPIFNNDLPMGRQLSRTVQVHVITPK